MISPAGERYNVTRRHDWACAWSWGGEQLSSRLESSPPQIQQEPFDRKWVMWTGFEHIKWVTEPWVLAGQVWLAQCPLLWPNTWQGKWSQIHTWADCPFRPQVGLDLVYDWEYAWLRWQHIPGSLFCIVSPHDCSWQKPVHFAAFMMRAHSLHEGWKPHTQTTGCHMVPSPQWISHYFLPFCLQGRLGRRY